MPLNNVFTNVSAALRPQQRKEPVACPQRLAIPSIAEIDEKDIKVTPIEAFLFDYFGRDSPIIPGGVFVTSVILMSGLVEFQKGNNTNQQTLMRLRVGAQALTVAAMMISLGVQERQKALGFKDPYDY